MNSVAKRTDVSEAKVVTMYKAEGIQIPFEKLDREIIPLGSTQIEITLADVPLDTLKLDKSNPRIRYHLEARNILGNGTENELTELLWENPEVKNLMRAIKANGGLIEAVIVTAEGTVVEGNCRTVCYRKLNEETQDANPGDEQWTKLRARILPKGITRDQLDILLGELHIAGKNEWRPFEQAAHLYRMSHKGGYSETRLAEFFRQSKTSINRKIRAYRLMVERYLAKYQDPGNLNNWSYFEEFYKVCKPKADDPEDIDLESKFVDWMGQNKFAKGAEVRQLPRILTNKDALDAFEKSGFSSAWEIVKADTPELDSTLFRSIAKATDELHNATLSEIEDVKKGDKAKLQKLLDLRVAVEDFLKQADKA